MPVPLPKYIQAQPKANSKLHTNILLKPLKKLHLLFELLLLQPLLLRLL
jgi:hypothetical protein